MTDLLKSEHPDPASIVENLFEVTADGLLNGNYAGFRNCFELPYTFETFEKTEVVQTEQEFRDLFNNVQRAYVEIGVTDIVRRCIVAEFRQNNTIIEATYETRLMRGKEQISEALPVYSINRLTGETWRVVSSIYGLDPSQPHVNAFTARRSE